MPIALLENVSRIYRRGGVAVHALSDVSLEVKRGDSVAIVGPSGSGKTTLLNVLGCLDRPTSGQVTIDNQPVTDLSRRGRARLRAARLGFVFQSFNLIPVLSAAENVEYPLLIRGGSTAAERRHRVRDLLDSLDIGELADQRPGELSAGQQQRVGIARALVAEPALVLADEPTANLDTDTGRQVMELMQRMNRERGVAFVVATHDPLVVRRVESAVRLVDGRLEG